MLSAFDRALQGAGVADFNLITLSSVIPAGSQVTKVAASTLEGDHGDVLYCVRSEAYATRPGDSAWAGLGWCVGEDGSGLFVEHHGGSEQSVVEQIELSLEDMKNNRPAIYGDVELAVSSAHCVDTAVCAVVVATYRVSGWTDVATAAGPATDSSVARTTAGVRSNGTSAPTAVAQPSWAKYVDPRLRITMEKELDYATAKRFYGHYLRAFGSMQSEAAARHILHESEFMEEMVNARVEKYVAWDDDGQAIGLSTLTHSLETTDWISPEYFAAHYSDHYARDAVFYIGYTVVEPSHQGSLIFSTMLKALVDRVVAAGGVAAWDVCAHNDERGLGDYVTRLLNAFADVTVQQIDTQHYYAGVFHGPR